MTDQQLLKPCPACKSVNVKSIIIMTLKTASRYSDICECLDCGMRGPIDDPSGEKWNALPREQPNTVSVPAEVVRDLGTLLAIYGYLGKDFPSEEAVSIQFIKQRYEDYINKAKGEQP